MDQELKANNQKRNRQSDCFQEDSNEPQQGSSILVKNENHSEFSAKKPRGDGLVASEATVIEDSSTMQSSKSNEDDYDDDDYDDYDDAEDHAGNLSDNEDFLEDFEDDVSVTSASTTVSTGTCIIFKNHMDML